MSHVEISWPLENVAQLALFGSEVHNFTDWQLQTKLEESLQEVQENDARVVILCSQVDGYFIAHGHIPQLVATFVDGNLDGDPMAAIRVQKELQTGAMVSIAAVEGQAWGGGAELALACDLRVVSRSATLAFHEVLVGTHPAGGVTRMTRLAGEATAKHLLLDGRPVSGEEAHRLGLAHRVTAPGEALKTAIDWAGWLVSHPPGALARNKELINEIRSLTHRDSLRLETARFLERFQDTDFVARIRQVQTRYDEGADSYEAFGMEKD